MNTILTIIDTVFTNMQWFVITVVLCTGKASVYGNNMEVSNFSDVEYTVKVLQPRVGFTSSKGLNVTINRPPSGTVVEFLGKPYNPYILYDTPFTFNGIMKGISRNLCSYVDSKRTNLYADDCVVGWLIIMTVKSDSTGVINFCPFFANFTNRLPFLH